MSALTIVGWPPSSSSRSQVQASPGSSVRRRSSSMPRWSHTPCSSPPPRPTKYNGGGVPGGAEKEHPGPPKNNRRAHLGRCGKEAPEPAAEPERHRLRHRLLEPRQSVELEQVAEGAGAAVAREPVGEVARDRHASSEYESHCSRLPPTRSYTACARWLSSAVSHSSRTAPRSRQRSTHALISASAAPLPRAWALTKRSFIVPSR